MLRRRCTPYRGGETWVPLSNGEQVSLAHKGDKVLLRGDNPTGLSISVITFTRFIMSGKIAASGSVMSLLDYYGTSTTIPNECCFHKLFFECESLTQAPELPATTLADKCYYFMFQGCSNLTKAPELPATTLAIDCYHDMFGDCTSLTQSLQKYRSYQANRPYYSFRLKQFLHVPGMHKSHESPGFAGYHFGGELLLLHVRNLQKPYESPRIAGYNLGEELLQIHVL